ncbi:MAG: hypothetical protein BMS9Abin07_0509 [Acidimicrobiia bacterium]|nr:MAG: hypothetical protein BMS9Abin07_0509 [Acidimicrobiia bacterium]
MAMSDEHKAALAKGRAEARAIKAYLAVVTTPKKRGRPVTRVSLEERISSLDDKIRIEDDPLSRVDLIQARIDARRLLDDLDTAADLSALEPGFIENAASYSNRKGITWTAWREAGVPAAALRSAGIKQTRHRS